MRKLIFFLLTTILISCGDLFDSSYTLPSICSPEIQYHLSSDCEDNPEIYIFEFVTKSAFSITIDGIEDILNEAEIGECVLVSFGASLDNVYIVNDAEKSWLVKDCN